MKVPLRLTSIENLCVQSGRLVFDLNGVDIHLNFSPASFFGAETLLIGFHGAIDRSSRPVPAFIPFLPGIGDVVHQLSVADPSLRTSPEISMSWYAGDSDFDAQHLLPKLFQDVSRALGVRRTIYFGTSGGGFAALFYSRQHSGSLAIVGNPQTKIGGFYPRHIDAYLSNCWPKLNSLDDLAGIVTTDVAMHYISGEIDNYVIYLQNSTDPFHLFGHMAPFLSSINNPVSRKRVACACLFPGKSGHNPIWEMFSPWVQAAVVSQDWEAENIILTHHALNTDKPSSFGSNVLTRKEHGNPVSRTIVASSDFCLANLLRDYHLRKQSDG